MAAADSSQFLVELAYDRTEESPMSVVGLRKGDYTIEIIGVNHSEPLPIDNMFTRLIPHIRASGCLVLVDHPVEMRNISGLPQAVKNDMRRFGGIGSVLLDLKEASYKKIECIDDRVIEGLINSKGEDIRRRKIKNLTSPSPENILDSFEILADLEGMVEHILSKTIPLFDEHEYDDLMLLHAESIRCQTVVLNTFKKLYDDGKLNFADNTIISGVSNWIIYVDTQRRLLENIINIGSLMVYVNVLDNIEASQEDKKEENREKKIVLVVGNVLLERLVNYYSDYTATFYSKTFDVELADMMPKNELRMDLRVLEILKTIDVDDATPAVSRTSISSRPTPKTSDAKRADERAGKILKQVRKMLQPKKGTKKKQKKHRRKSRKH